MTICAERVADIGAKRAKVSKPFDKNGRKVRFIPPFFGYLCRSPLATEPRYSFADNIYLAESPGLHSLADIGLRFGVSITHWKNSTNNPVARFNQRIKKTSLRSESEPS